MRQPRRVVRSALVSLLLVAAGCAEVHVRKVDADGRPTGPDGLRFYMPRPYVLVHEPFIVGAKACLLNGRLTSDGQYVVLGPVTGSGIDPDLAASLSALAPAGRVPASTVIALPEGQPPAGGQAGLQGRPADADSRREAGDGQGRRGGDESGDGGRGGQGSGDASAPPRAPPDGGPQGRGGEADGEPAGQGSIKVTNDNTAFAVTPLKRYIDIVWLPDFEEQYVVEAEPGFGNAEIALRLGQGWSLQALDAHTDNSAVLGPLVELYGQAAGLVSEVARARLGLPAHVAGLQGRSPEETAELEAGMPVTVKVTLVRIATPGLYPVLKPSETVAVNQQDARRLLVPVPPLTNVAFNVAEVLVVEAARAGGDAALRLYQYVDVGGSRDVTGSAGPEPSQALAPAALEQAILRELLDRDITGWGMRVEEAHGEDRTFVVTATRPRGSGEQDDERVRKFIRDVIEARGGTVGNLVIDT